MGAWYWELGLDLAITGSFPSLDSVRAESMASSHGFGPEGARDRFGGHKGFGSLASVSGERARHGTMAMVGEW